MPRIGQSPSRLNQFGFGPRANSAQQRPIGTCAESAVGGMMPEVAIVTRLEPDQIRDVIQRELEPIAKRLDLLEERQTRIEALLHELRDLVVSQQTIKEWYTPSEVAQILDRRPYTVQEWCRLQRVNARKRPTGRGDADEWEISHDEVERIRNHGLLPIPAKY
jgi:hypothetical protein